MVFADDASLNHSTRLTPEEFSELVEQVLVVALLTRWQIDWSTWNSSPVPIGNKLQPLIDHIVHTYDIKPGTADRPTLGKIHAFVGGKWWNIYRNLSPGELEKLYHTFQLQTLKPYNEKAEAI